METEARHREIVPLQSKKHPVCLCDWESLLREAESEIISRGCHQTKQKNNSIFGKRKGICQEAEEHGSMGNLL